MKTIICVSLFFILCGEISSQDINVHKLINKKKSDVIKNYGKPVHQDNSNPDMICMFYKGTSSNFIFVSDKEGIFQAEATVNYSKEKDARSSIDSFILNSVADEYSVDTVTTSDFQLEKPGVKVDLQLSENQLTKKFDIRVKAKRISYN